MTPTPRPRRPSGSSTTSTASATASPTATAAGPAQQDCPHPNACLTCPDFQTTPVFLEIHRRQAETNRTLITQADGNGQQRLAENLRRVQANLDRIIPPWKRSRVRDPPMARADNSSFLTEANARRRQAALSAAHHAIEQLQRQGQASELQPQSRNATGVSRGWLYRQDQIRDLISRQRAHSHRPRRLTAQRATTDSLRRGSMPPATEITRLREREPLPPRADRPPASASSGPGTPKTRQPTAMTDEDPQPRRRHVYAAETAVYQA